MSATGLHISISAEPVFTIGGLTFSNSMLTSLIVSGLLIAFAVAVKLSLSQTNRPRGLQNVAEWLVESLYGLVTSVANTKVMARCFFPFVATFFLFIMFNNYLGLIPGVGTIGFTKQEEEIEHIETTPEVIESEVDEHNFEYTATELDEVTQHDVEAEITEDSGDEHGEFVPLFRAGTADLNTTIALALVSIFMVQVFGVQTLHLSYFKKFFDFSNPINAYVGILELISEFAKIISFAFRLFGNIFAGEVLLTVIGFLVPIIAPMPFYGLELFVGFIQALVFAMLTLVFFNMATQGHSEH